MTLNSLIRKIHLYIGLQALLALGLFSIATIAATFHSDDDLDWEVSRQNYTGRTDLGVQDLEQAVYAQVGQHYEHVSPERIVSGAFGEKISYKYFSPNGKRIVTLSVPDREIEIRTHRLGLAMYLNRMHTESLGRRKSGDELWLWAWSLYIELSLFALFLLPVTGFYIWLQRRNRQGWAKLSLIISGSLMLLVFYSVR